MRIRLHHSLIYISSKLGDVKRIGFFFKLHVCKSSMYLAGAWNKYYGWLENTKLSFG